MMELQEKLRHFCEEYIDELMPMVDEIMPEDVYEHLLEYLELPDNVYTNRPIVFAVADADGRAFELVCATIDSDGINMESFYAETPI